MRLLLDTHVAIWALASPELLTPAVCGLIADADNSIYVSSASIWEISIKHALRKPSSPPFSGADALRYFRASGYLLLDVTAEHAAAVETLPPLHADPFDRMLVAQARAEPLRLVTHDPKVADYSDTIIKF